MPSQPPIPASAPRFGWLDAISAMTGWILLGGMLKVIRWAESPAMAVVVGLGVIVTLTWRLHRIHFPERTK
jgi:hypothetical protein